MLYKSTTIFTNLSKNGILTAERALKHLSMKLFTSKILVALSALFLFLMPLTTHASSYIAKDSYTLGQDETADSNLYIGGTNVSINGTASGDVIAAGNTVTINGTVADDTIVAAGTLNVAGTINDDLRVAAGTITISGTILGDVNAAGGSITFDKDAVVKGDVILGGGTVTLAGTVEGNVGAGTSELTVSGTVGGNIDATTSMLTLTDTAHVAGALSYRSNTEASIASGATIDGGTTFLQHPNRSRIGMYFGIIGLSIGGFLINVIASLIVALLFVTFMKPLTKRIITTGIASFWKMALIGFLLLIVAPILGIMLLVSLLGIPLAGILLSIYITLLVVAGVFAGILLGTFLLKWMKRQSDSHTQLASCSYRRHRHECYFLFRYWMAGRILFLYRCTWRIGDSLARCWAGNNTCTLLQTQSPGKFHPGFLCRLFEFWEKSRCCRSIEQPFISKLCFHHFLFVAIKYAREIKRNDQCHKSQATY